MIDVMIWIGFVLLLIALGLVFTYELRKHLADRRLHRQMREKILRDEAMLRHPAGKRLP